ncbi:MAG: prolyl oligopeptidase family serine peptidase [Candidatus Heimdallarchaeota archaeon]
MFNAESLGKQRTYMFEQIVHLGYLLFLPQCYGTNPDEKWPLILYLHGIGERGNDLELVKKHGIPKIVERQPDFQFVTVSPQCPAETFWWEHNGTLKALLDGIMTKYAIDLGRIYLTGNSMGGYGTWSLAIANPERFAAIAPICGGGSPEFVCALKDIPVWAFHGAEDEVIRLKESQRMVNALQACGGNVRFTIYPGIGHDSWTQTYNNPELYEWFLQYSR